MKKVTLTIVVENEELASKVASQIEKSDLGQEGIYILACGTVSDLSKEEAEEVNNYLKDFDMAVTQNSGLENLAESEMNEIKGGEQEEKVEDEEKGFYYKGIFFEPMRRFTPDEHLMGVHLPLSSSKINNYDSRKKLVDWSHDEFYQRANERGFGKFDVFKRKDGRLMVPGSNEIFYFNPGAIYEDTFYHDKLKVLRKEQKS